MKARIVTVLAGALLLLASASFATPVLNNPSDDFEDRANGSIYATYVNSGKFLYFVAHANNEGNNLSEVQTALNNHLGSNFTLVEDSNVATTGVPGTLSGTWTVTPSGGLIDFYIVKAANAYAMYEVTPADGYGSWSTFDLWSEGYGGQGGLGISHFTGYDGSTPVPEPGTVMLLGAGIFGLAVYQKRRRNNKA